MNLIAILHKQSKERYESGIVRGSRGVAKALILGHPKGSIQEKGPEMTIWPAADEQDRPYKILNLAPMYIYSGITCFHVLSFDRDKLKNNPPIYINGLDYGTDYTVEGCLLFAPASDAIKAEKQCQSIFSKISGMIKSLFIQRR